MSEYRMAQDYKEGPITEISYRYPANKILEYMRSLPIVKDTCHRPVQIKDRVMVMTHDDELDASMDDVPATWFMLSWIKRDYDQCAGKDIQLHWDKSYNTLLKEQAEQLPVCPLANRTHRLLWRSDNFDFPMLAMNGISIDSSKIGGQPYHPVINGRLLPIVELPISITDRPMDFKALYQDGCHNHLYFQNGVTPIVVDAHPFAICEKHNMQSCYYECVGLAQKYGYRIVRMKELYAEYIKGIL